jgi:hypothetical protein
MSRLVLAASLVAAIAVAACGAAPTEPAPSPSANPTVPSAPPSVAPPSAAPPVTSPPPSVTPPPPSPEPSPADFTAAERYLLDGILRGAEDCQPAGGSDDLPKDAIAGIECASPDPAVARIGFYLFANDGDMLDAYLARMKAEGVALDSGICNEGEREGAYIPWEGDEIAPYRVGCFINDEGYANYRVTLPGAHVYIGILGRSGDMVALEDFAWLGSRDTPGNPTLWGDRD